MIKVSTFKLGWLKSQKNGQRSKQNKHQTHMPTIYKPKKEKEKTQKTKERQKIYNTSRWRRLRRYKLNAFPVCELCGKHQSEEVHHRDSFMNYTDERTRDAVAFNPDNLVALCALCHRSMHGGAKTTHGGSGS